MIDPKSTGESDRGEACSYFVAQARQAFDSGAGESYDLPHIFCPLTSYLQL